MAMLLGSVTEGEKHVPPVRALESGRISGQKGLRLGLGGKQRAGFDPEPARLTARPHAAKTLRLLPAASCDTIQVKYWVL